jgi:hypothetical protein
MFRKVLDPIPPAIPDERRRSRRIAIQLQVEVEIRGEQLIGRITELSRAGGRIDVPGVKSVGDAVIIRRGGIELHGHIVWAESVTAGLWFPAPMDEDTFLQLRRKTVS